MIRLFAVLMIFGSTFTWAQDCAPEPLQSELLRRQDIDQVARKRLMDAPESQDALTHTLQVDRENTAFMREMIAKCGWPKQSAVGERAAKAAWMLTQHADMDPEYQVMAARLLKGAVLAKEANPSSLAVLVDRNRRLTDQPQVYGMQYYKGADGTVRFFDIITPGQLDKRRADIGLEPFYCWALQASSQYGGAPIEWPAGVLFVPDECADAN